LLSAYRRGGGDVELISIYWDALPVS
jgi:hypothetical protein